LKHIKPRSILVRSYSGVFYLRSIHMKRVIKEKPKNENEIFIDDVNPTMAIAIITIFDSGIKVLSKVSQLNKSKYFVVISLSEFYDSYMDTFETINELITKYIDSKLPYEKIEIYTTNDMSEIWKLKKEIDTENSKNKYFNRIQGVSE
jgi:hypothetical protein